MTLLREKILVFSLVASCAVLGTCADPDVPNRGDPAIIQKPHAQIEAEREMEKREALRYKEALATAPLYRSKIRDLLLRHPEQFRNSGRIGLRTLWIGADRSQAFRCIHAKEPISRAEQDGWQLVLCDRYSAYFLRGPVVAATEERNKSIAPRVEEVFDVLRISYSSTPLTEDEASLERHPAIDAALPNIYDPPTKADLASVGTALDTSDEVMVAYYDFQRRKEISVYNQASQTVLTLIFRHDAEFVPAGAKGTRLVENAVLWAQSPRTDFAAMSGLLSLAQDYLTAPVDRPDGDSR